MDKKSDSILTSSQKDSQRLREVFFPSLSKKEYPKKKIFFISAFVFFILFFIYFLLNYQFIFIPRSSLKLPENTTTLLHNDTLSSLHLPNKNEKLIKIINSSIYASIPPREKVEMVLNFKKPQNLDTHRLFFWIKKSDTSFVMKVIARDSRFFSNARNPIHINIDKKEKIPFIKVPVHFETSSSPNVNFSKITQIKVYFYRQPDKKGITPVKDNKKYEENWILIKDITLARKENKWK